MRIEPVWWLGIFPQLHNWLVARIKTRLDDHNVHNYWPLYDWISQDDKFIGILSSEIGTQNKSVLMDFIPIETEIFI